VGVRFVSFTLALEKELRMLSVALLSLVCAAAEPNWHDKYSPALEQAQKEKKDLLIYFRANNSLDKVLADPKIKARLAKFVLLKVPVSYKYAGKRLLDYDAFEEMMGKPGLAIASYSDPKLASHNQLISAHPLVGSHYRWVPDYGVKEIAIILDLPATATISQRSMIYAVSVHPERPRSVHGKAPRAFLNHAERHSLRQASMQHQHHANIIATSNQLASEVNEAVSGGSEVVAESWGRVVGGENVLEASFSCVDAWRHSSGHWGAVSRAHKYFGYDIAKGANGTWYATGIFAD
jgi:hypothetical protein